MQQIEAIAKSTEPFRVNFDEAWVWIGYSRKDAAKRVLVNNFKEGLDYRVFLRSEENPIEPIGGRPSEVIHLTTNCFKKFCMMAGNLRLKSLPIASFKIYLTDLAVLKRGWLMRSPRLILVLNVGFCSTAFELA